MPAWDTKRIVDGRWDHLDWMHDHFADEVLLAGEESETIRKESTDGERDEVQLPACCRTIRSTTRST